MSSHIGLMRDVDLSGSVRARKPSGWFRINFDILGSRICPERVLGCVGTQDSHFLCDVIQAPKREILMIRMVLRDDQWARMESYCLGKKSDPGRSGADNRLFMEAVLWKARTGSPWRDLPDAFGNWSTVFRRFRDWSVAGVFERLFEAVSDDPDMEYAMIDATIVPVHRHGHGAKGGLKIRRLANPKAAGQPRSLL